MSPTVQSPKGLPPHGGELRDPQGTSRNKRNTQLSLQAQQGEVTLPGSRAGIGHWSLGEPGCPDFCPVIPNSSVNTQMPWPTAAVDNPSSPVAVRDTWDPEVELQ